MNQTINKWKVGPQGGTYLKKILKTGKILGYKWDICLLKLKKGDEIPWHIDESDKPLYKLNFLIKKAKCGGKFLCPLPILDIFRISLYRADIEPHTVTEVKSGEVVILSIGLSW